MRRQQIVMSKAEEKEKKRRELVMMKAYETQRRAEVCALAYAKTIISYIQFGFQ